MSYRYEVEAQCLIVVESFRPDRWSLETFSEPHAGRRCLQHWPDADPQAPRHSVADKLSSFRYSYLYAVSHVPCNRTPDRIIESQYDGV